MHLLYCYFTQGSHWNTINERQFHAEHWMDQAIQQWIAFTHPCCNTML